MKKLPISQRCHYGLIVLVSSTALLSTSHRVSAQTANNLNTQTNYTIDFVSPYFQTQPSPVQKIPAPVGTLKVNSRCNDARVIEGETTNFVVMVCKENGQLLYIGKDKQEPNKPVKLAAKVVGKSKYRADNGSYSYFVNPEGVEVWQNGRKVRFDRFRVSKVF